MQYLIYIFKFIYIQRRKGVTQVGKKPTATFCQSRLPKCAFWHCEPANCTFDVLFYTSKFRQIQVETHP